MSLEDIFPEDPRCPTLRYAIFTEAPLAIPWATTPMAIGTPFFAPSKDDNAKATFGKDGGETAFDRKSLASTSLVFNRGSSGGHAETTAASSSSSQERLHVDISAQIGGSFIGASGRGQFDKNAAKNAGAIESSSRTFYRCGQISLERLPRLSDEALKILRAAGNDPAGRFRARFGAYFVAGYVLGGTSVNMITGAGADEATSKRLNIDYEGHVGWFSVEGNIREESQESSRMTMGSMTVYDSLADQHLEVSIRDYGSALAVSEENKRRGEMLPQRVAVELGKLGLHSDGAKMVWTRCPELCRSGLVLELLMLPWAGLRDYASAILAPREK